MVASADAVGFKRMWERRQLDTMAKAPGGLLAADND